MGPLKVLANEHSRFANREEAGNLLARALIQEGLPKPIVLGIPRGGVVVANKIAQEMDADLDLVFAHKLGAPGQPECAIGAVAEDGNVIVDRNLYFSVSRAYLEQEKKSQMLAMDHRKKAYRSTLPKISLKNRTVIVTDDGVAMGYTVEAALGAVRSQKPQKIILALPVGPKETLARLAQLADETVCLVVPGWFEGVSQVYDDFPQVEDPQVLRILEKERQRRAESIEKPQTA